MKLLQAALAMLGLELLTIPLEVVIVVAVAVVAVLKIVTMVVMAAVRIYTHITVWLLTNNSIKHSR